MSAPRQRARLLAWLRAREPAQPVTVIETHISIIAFQGERAYKLKKAVRYAFIDLSTPEKRRVDCERELVLNRRLAPDVYLGIEPITDGHMPVEYVVVMRRLPDARRLGALVAQRDDALTCIDRIAPALARFHAGADSGGVIDEAATRDAVSARWQREFTETASFDDIVLPSSIALRIAMLVPRYLAGRATLFDARIAAGRARDGHGDLLADDVFCMPDGPRILDCLEFSDRLRYGDVLADVAFLAMDLERLGHPELARRFLDRYRDDADDDWPRSLEHFYIAYRAHVRAKIAALTRDEHHARALFTIAADHLEAGRIRLVLLGGPPATGKTTLASAIARATSWSVLHSDEVRKQLAGLAPNAPAPAALDHGIYTSHWTTRTYTALCERARELLVRGQSVILDATWSDPHWRDAAHEVALATSSDLVMLRCWAPPGLARNRAAQRIVRDAGASDASPEVAAALTARFAPWPQAATIDTTLPAAEAKARALEAVGPS